ncbi:hypothetical protein DFH11DRAFT_1582385, partial [Phellopilus nigrolimitatus]
MPMSSPSPSDIRSFDVALYVLVCGKLPFDNQSIPALYAKLDAASSNVQTGSAQNASTCSYACSSSTHPTRHPRWDPLASVD